MHHQLLFFFTKAQWNVEGLPQELNSLLLETQMEFVPLQMSTDV